MNFMPIIIMNLLLLVITILLAIADRLLVNYGECKITVSEEDERKEFTVQGGGYLLPTLTDNKINISSSCGGKASCGYCKIRVKKGGGQILPTEELFMSKEEKLNNMRLACQVKVKNDIEIYIPDYLTVVKDIVKNKTFDPKLRWQFMISKQIGILSEKRRIKLPKKEQGKIQEIIEKYKDRRGTLIPILQKINIDFNYLPEPVLGLLSENMNIPLSKIYWASTFYNVFSLKPKGRNIIKVCLGTSCYVKEGERILRAIENKLSIKVDEYTKDLKFSLETVSCIGCCGQSPVISINDEIYGYLKLNMIDRILKKYD